jgi:AmmeMemoRadiSam system protein A
VDLEHATRRYLLARARAALADALGVPEPSPARPEDPRLVTPARVFVSWHLGERLIGCIGTLEARESLDVAVERYAVEAGMNDPRTAGAQRHELARLACEISVLGESQPLEVLGLDAIAHAIVPRRDGVILSCGVRRAVFLPVVWDKLPEPPTFLQALARKAGLDPTRDGPSCRAAVFATETFTDASRAPD